MSNSNDDGEVYKMMKDNNVKVWIDDIDTFYKNISCSQPKVQINNSTGKLLLDKCGFMDLGEKSICSICLDTLVKTETAYLNTCYHAFCIKCICKWAKIRRTCPLCKEKFHVLYFDIKSTSSYKVLKLPRLKSQSCRPVRNYSYHLRKSNRVMPYYTRTNSKKLKSGDVFVNSEEIKKCKKNIVPYEKRKQCFNNNQLK